MRVLEYVLLPEKAIYWRILHGNLYGIVSRATGVTELVSPYTDGSVPEDEYGSFGAVEIDESELGNYESQLVRFRTTKRIIFEDVLGRGSGGVITLLIIQRILKE